MSQIDYTAMSDQELRQYFLKHREDKTALQAYLERRRERSGQVITVQVKSLQQLTSQISIPRFKRQFVSKWVSAKTDIAV